MTFECEQCNNQIRFQSLSTGYVVVNFCKNCLVAMPPVEGKKAIKITIDGITSDPSKPTWENFLLYWNNTETRDAIVELSDFESMQDKNDYISFLEKLGILK